MIGNAHSCTAAESCASEALEIVLLEMVWLVDDLKAAS